MFFPNCYQTCVNPGSAKSRAIPLEQEYPAPSAFSQSLLQVTWLKAGADGPATAIPDIQDWNCHKNIISFNKFRERYGHCSRPVLYSGKNPPYNIFPSSFGSEPTTAIRIRNYLLFVAPNWLLIRIRYEVLPVSVCFFLCSTNINSNIFRTSLMLGTRVRVMR